MRTSAEDIEQEILESYGGWARFCHAFALLPSNEEDTKEANRILRDYVCYYMAKRNGIRVHPEFTPPFRSSKPNASGEWQAQASTHNSSATLEPLLSGKG